MHKPAYNRLSVGIHSNDADAPVPWCHDSAREIRNLNSNDVFRNERNRLAV